MTFTTTLVDRGQVGRKQFKIYSVANDGTTGTIVSGFRKVDHVSVTNKTSSTGIYYSVSGGTVTVTTASGDDFTAMVIGV